MLPFVPQFFIASTCTKICWQSAIEKTVHDKRRGINFMTYKDSCMDIHVQTTKNSKLSIVRYTVSFLICMHLKNRNRKMSVYMDFKIQSPGITLLGL